MMLWLTFQTSSLDSFPVRILSLALSASGFPNVPRQRSFVIRRGLKMKQDSDPTARNSVTIGPTDE
jgi:hypothetical protein